MSPNYAAPGLHVIRIGTASGRGGGPEKTNVRRRREDGTKAGQHPGPTPAAESGRQRRRRRSCSGFQMPLHYPRYKREDYEKMEGWKLDLLLGEYGLSFDGPLEEKRAYAMGAFLWPAASCSG